MEATAVTQLLFTETTPPEIDDPSVRDRLPMNNWRKRIHDRILVVNEYPERHIYVDHKLWMTYNVRRQDEERLAITMLAGLKIMTHHDLAAAFGVSTRSVERWLHMHRQQGLRRLLDNTTPPKEVATTGSAAQQEPLSFSSQDAPEPALDEKNEVPVNLSPEQVIPAASASTPSTVPAVTAAPSGPVMHSRYIGLLLIAPFYHQLMEPMLEYILAHDAQLHTPWKQYRIDDIMAAITVYTLQGALCPEQVKSIHAEEFGVVLGKERGPCCDTLRRNLAALGRHGLPEVFEQSLLERLLALGYIEVGLVHLDGHFVPYHGKAPVAKGYWPQRQGPFKGFEQFWATDHRGRPIVCRLEQAFIAFPRMIVQIAQQLKDQLAAAGKTEPLILVFDRGAYSATLFAQLDELGVGWITYQKGNVYHKPEFFSSQVQILRSNDKVFTTLYEHKQVTITGYRTDVHALALYNPNRDTQATLITNLDRLYPEACDPMLLIGGLKDRWCEENFFKVAKTGEDIDHLMGFDISPMGDEEYLVPNPKYHDALQRIEQLRTRQVKIQRQVDTLLKRYQDLKRKPGFERWMESKKNQKLLATHKAISSELVKLESQVEQEPEYISYKQLKEKEYNVFRFHRHRVIMGLKMVAYHVRQQMREMAAKFFSDPRELSKFLYVLLRAGGSYEFGMDHDTIRLVAPAMPRYREAAQALLHAFNELHPTTLDRRRKPLVFALEARSVPQRPFGQRHT